MTKRRKKRRGPSRPRNGMPPASNREELIGRMLDAASAIYLCGARAMLALKESDYEKFDEAVEKSKRWQALVERYSAELGLDDPAVQAIRGVTLH